jgi:hypothetical protein
LPQYQEKPTSEFKPNESGHHSTSTKHITRSSAPSDSLGADT